MAKEGSGKKKFILIPVAIIFVIAALALILWRVPLRSLVVTGNQYCSSDFVKEQVLPENQRNILMTIYHMLAPKKNIAALDEYHIEFSGWGMAEIVVEEKQAVASIPYGGLYLYLNESAVVMGQVLAPADSLPVLSGVSIISFAPFEVVETDEVEGEILTNSLSIAGQMIQSGISASQLNYSQDGTWNLLIGEVKVLLGNMDYMEGKLLEVKSQWPHYEGLKGTLHMENYDSSQNTFYFKTE